MNKFLMKVEKYLGAFFLQLLNLTIKKERFGDYPTQPCVFMLWHRDQIPLVLLHQHKKVGVLISQSKDGELISGPISKLGYVPVRGSSTRGGTKALRGLLSHLKGNSVAITPDGPRGPIYTIKDGLLTTAYLSKRPIIPVAIDVSREWCFNSWDKFRVPKPFSSMRMKYGKLHFVKNKDDFPAIKAALKEEIEEMYQTIKYK